VSLGLQLHGGKEWILRAASEGVTVQCDCLDG
jgi:hypothetical protein